jgi:hypothetical protein
VRQRRRDFKMVPMILNHPDQWDHTALFAAKTEAALRSRKLYQY